jgi:hypothetical protein
LILLGLYGGDDGARTRDLCRDRTNLDCNLLKLKRTGGSDSAQNDAKTPFRTHIEPRFMYRSRGLSLTPLQTGTYSFALLSPKMHKTLCEWTGFLH